MGWLSCGLLRCRVAGLEWIFRVKQLRNMILVSDGGTEETSRTAWTIGVHLGEGGKNIRQRRD
jgi:hypothetical protein